MPLYRFYMLTAGDHIALRREADCDNDARAIAAATELFGTYPAVEVWKDVRRVIRLTAEDIIQTQRTAPNRRGNAGKL
jgi:hypothetical protein